MIGLLALAACTRDEPPAPVDLHPTSRSPMAPPGLAAAPAPRAVAAGPALGGRDTVYTVERGDTAYAVARRFDIPVKSIIDANNLQPPYGLVAGQRLAIPKPRAHFVVAGDTVQSVARRYGIDMSALVRVNDIPSPYALRPGQRLALPAPVAGTATQQAANPAPPVPAVPPPPPRAVEVAALPPPVQPAETPRPPPPSSAPPPIAAAPPAPRSAPVEKSAAVAPAEKPIAPAPVGKPVAVTAAEKPGAPPPSMPPAPTPVPPVAASPPPPAGAAGAAPAQVAALPAPNAAAVAPAADVAPVEPTVAAVPHDTTPVGPPPPRAGKTFLWPVHGRVISTYGEQGQGLRNDGINIAAARGTPIRAAENGVVAYAGNEIRGFGNLLLIRHAGGYMTAYAHADVLLVKRGDTVHRGQVIARVGATGSATEPQLHFEIREGSQPVDPQRFLGSPSA